MEDKFEERKSFMRRNILFPSYIINPFLHLHILTSLTLANFIDPMKRGEEYAISLRKKNKMQVITAKRRRVQEEFE
jgi:hypothetical protein